MDSLSTDPDELEAELYVEVVSDALAADPTPDSSLPVTPREELGALLRADTTRLGDVFRGLEDNKSANDIANDLNVSTSGFVGNYKAKIEALLDGVVPGPSYLSATGAAARSFLKKNRGALSSAAAALLQGHIYSLEKAYDSVISDESPLDTWVADSQEEELAETLTRLAHVAGIYAFSYGWYLESPVDADRGNTLIKVGRSDQVGRRLVEHQGYAVKTHMPEPVSILRIYTTKPGESQLQEKRFHKLLSTAGHDNPRRTVVRGKSEVGKEWFLTNADFLDAIAEACGLKTEYIGMAE
ncbi:hypothetical protein GU243_19190 [Pseudarthrobacter psychrotolerans]|uniref:Bacteriophage T5 Orf172 DNA-binding domain-containing protein n=1 Tax=Pseudarthrobacter psychrotolerans TaxID=2697569 RepID=A0A6P1NVE3_9MICC|nr:GIY-YIG nuclease family protein [Pseudarthrobacter psychrotolerans]QHK21472.1 hypothetical protein GU243_19190 [Pseudarthrobacter psychrotolerans]